MLPAVADTQRACALSRFTDVKTGEQLYVLMFFFLCSRSDVCFCEA